LLLAGVVDVAFEAPPLLVLGGHDPDPARTQVLLPLTCHLEAACQGLP
jgi:hypothetical protein